MSAAIFMSNQRSQSAVRRSSEPRPQPGRPPIAWPARKPKLPDHHERAAQLARRQVDHAHTIGAAQQHAKKHHEKVIHPLPKETTAAEIGTQTAPQHPPTQQEAEPYDWASYHSAWQQYYHRYFYQYYALWWLQNPALKKPDEATEPAELKHLSEKQRAAAELRNKIRTTVSKRAQKMSSSSHFKPFLAAFGVGLTFLLINYNQVIVGAMKQYIAPGSVVTTPVIVEPNVDGMVGPEPKIIIPKIGVEVPVVYDEQRVDEQSYQKALERGVVRLGTTANPGEKGNVVIGGHSSNNVFNAGDYKYVFVNLKRLEVGDVFYLHYKGQRYTYKVTVAKKIISPTDTSVLAPTTKPIVTLFTCDPPGTNVNRLIVQAEQIDPDPNAATASQKPTSVNESNPLPSVAPSLWDRLFN